MSVCRHVVHHHAHTGISPTSFKACDDPPKVPTWARTPHGTARSWSGLPTPARPGDVPNPRQRPTRAYNAIRYHSDQHGTSFVCGRDPDPDEDGSYIIKIGRPAETQDPDRQDAQDDRGGEAEETA